MILLHDVVCRFNNCHLTRFPSLLAHVQNINRARESTAAETTHRRFRVALIKGPTLTFRVFELDLRVHACSRLSKLIALKLAIERMPRFGSYLDRASTDCALLRSHFTGDVTRVLLC